MKRCMLAWVLGCGAALLGCDEDRGYNTPGLYNRRDHPLEVTVRVARQCDAGTDLSDPTLYGPPRTRRMLARDLIGLRTLKSLESSYEQSAPLGGCSAVWLELPGLYEAVLSWEVWNSWFPEDDPYDFALVVEGTRNDVVVHIPARMRELPPPEL